MKDSIDLQWTDAIPECPVFVPSKEEFDDPFDYLQKIAPLASKYGICKIVCPVNACVPARDVLTKEFKFETIVQPVRVAMDVRDKVEFFKRGRKYRYGEFERMANKAFVRRFSGSYPSAVSLEKEFWCEMTRGRRGTVEYGVNVEGSAFSSDPNDMLAKSKWNLKNISRLPKSSLRFLERSIPGITDPMLYIGMLFSIFAWHAEDHYLYSINYHHCGAAKTWYGVPADFAHRLERVVIDHVYCHSPALLDDSEDEAFRVMSNKTTMFPPSLLLRNDVPVYKATQMPGEFVVTFPRSYHAGFSHGFNCGEAVNFATGDWFPFGSEATQRYTRLEVFPVIPYEELVCNEAMCLFESLKRPPSSLAHLSIKLSLLQIVTSYEEALTQPFQEPPRAVRSVSAVCGICGRDCFLACMICSSCSLSSLCLNHGTDRIDCSCGSKSWTLFARDDVLAYKDVARAFKREKLVAMEIKRGTERSRL